MTPLLGTRNPSTPVGDAPGGDGRDGRAARSLLSCAAWGGYGAAWAATVPRAGNTAFPVHQTSGISSGANQAPQPWFSRNTRHETRITASLPTISHHFPRFPGISRPPPPPLRRSSVHAPSAFLGQPPGTAAPARSLLSCALWRGMGGMARPEPLSAHRQHRQHGLFGFHETRDTNHETRLFFESRPLLWLGMGGYGAAWAAYFPAPAYLPRQPFSVGLTASAARRAAPSAANAR